jgi:hypothetical protein
MLYGQGMGAMETGARLGFLENRKRIAAFLLVVVNWPPGVNPMPQLQQPPKFIALT